MNIEFDAYKKCTVEGCPFPLRSAKLCSAHYFQFKRAGRITKPDLKRTPSKCSVDICNSVEYMKGFCLRHYTQILKHGEIKHTHFDRNTINKKKDYSELICETKDGKKIVSLIDNDDILKVSKYRWHVASGGYIGNSKVGRLARFLMGLPCGSINRHVKTFSQEAQEVDHINRNRLDNRRANLRIVTRLGNMQNKNIYKNNSTGYVGISFHRLTGKWYYQMSYDGVSIFSTLYDNKNTVIEKRKHAIALLKDSKNPNETFSQIVDEINKEKETRHVELYKNIEKCCQQCGKHFLVANKQRRRDSKYCSRSCYWQSKKGKSLKMNFRRY